MTVKYPKLQIVAGDIKVKNTLENPFVVGDVLHSLTEKFYGNFGTIAANFEKVAFAAALAGRKNQRSIADRARELKWLGVVFHFFIVIKEKIKGLHLIHFFTRMKKR